MSTVLNRARPSIEDLPLWALSQGASCFIIDLAAYETCRVAGIVQRLRLDPVNGVIQVTVWDGTGTVSAEWVICRPTPQLVLSPGRGVVLTGATSIGLDGDVVLTEPHFVVASMDEAMPA
jgi:hypothetical protein